MRPRQPEKDDPSLGALIISSPLKSLPEGGTEGGDSRREGPPQGTGKSQGSGVTDGSHSLPESSCVSRTFQHHRGFSRAVAVKADPTGGGFCSHTGSYR